MSDRPAVHILFTGGTISMRREARLRLEGTGAGNVPPAALPGIRAALRARVPVVGSSRADGPSRGASDAGQFRR